MGRGRASQCLPAMGECARGTPSDWLGLPQGGCPWSALATGHPHALPGGGGAGQQLGHGGSCSQPTGAQPSTCLPGKGFRSGVQPQGQWPVRTAGAAACQGVGPLPPRASGGATHTARGGPAAAQPARHGCSSGHDARLRQPPRPLEKDARTPARPRPACPRRAAGPPAYLALHQHVEEVVAGLLRVGLPAQVAQVVARDAQAGQAPPHAGALVVQTAALGAGDEVKEGLGLRGGYGGGLSWGQAERERHEAHGQGTGPQRSSSPPPPRSASCCPLLPGTSRLGGGPSARDLHCCRAWPRRAVGAGWLARKPRH